MSMNGKPIQPDTKVTGNLAVTYIQAIFEEKGWIFRRADGSNDYGIDSEVEIVDRNSVTGKIFKCQIKGTDGLEFNGEGHCSVQVNTSTWNNWKEMNLPVVALLCNVQSKESFWSLPLAYEPKPKADTVAIRFSHDHSLKTSLNEFVAVITTWLEAFPKKNILLEVPFYHRLYVEDLKPLINWGDAWMEVGDEENMQIRVFYSHVLELRSSLGFTNDKIIPYSFWLIRNDGLWSDTTMLYHGTASEVLSYIGHFYEQTMERLKTRLAKIEPSFENNELLNYFKLTPYETHYSNALAKDPTFHKIIESTLKSVGYSRFSWSPKK